MTEDQPTESEPEEGSPERSYKNLFVPLFVVPAMIVMVLVLVFVLFGQIAGDEASIQQNLERVRFGGKNEREQALFHVVQQVEQNWAAMQDGRELPWPVDGEVETQLERVWEQTPREDASFRYVLAAALVQVEADGGLEKLLACLDYTAVEDEDGLVRFSALFGLGSAGDEFDDEERGRVVGRVLPFLDDSDHGLQVMAALALQNLPEERTAPALRGLLSDGSLELRAQAAVSLSHLGDPAGSGVLWELLEPETFERERERNSEKFRQPRLVQAIRAKAVEALVRLGRAEDLERLRVLAEEEADLGVREAAMRGVRLLEPADSTP